MLLISFIICWRIASSESDSFWSDISGDFFDFFFSLFFGFIFSRNFFHTEGFLISGSGFLISGFLISGSFFVRNFFHVEAFFFFAFTFSKASGLSGYFICLLSVNIQNSLLNHDIFPIYFQSVVCISSPILNITHSPFATFSIVGSTGRYSSSKFHDSATCSFSGSITGSAFSSTDSTTGISTTNSGFLTGSGFLISFHASSSFLFSNSSFVIVVNAFTSAFFAALFFVILFCNISESS